MEVAFHRPGWSGIVLLCLKLDTSRVTALHPSACHPAILFMPEPCPSQEWGNWSQLRADGV